MNHRLWSARLLETDPGAIRQAHLAYLEAGAQCIITSSYQASIPGFLSLGFDQATAEAFILSSTSLAREAVRDFMALHPEEQPPLVAASIGPYGAFLADGSEYRGQYGLTDEELVRFHRPRLKLLATTEADCFACETIPDFQEARVLGELLMEFEKPAWISFSCRDGKHLNDGSYLRECSAVFAAHPRVFAIGINCTPPQYISEAISVIKEVSGDKRVVVYPNSGEVYHAASKTWSGTSDLSFFSLMVREWLNLGADIIGGCCRLGPETIRAIARVIHRRQST